MQNDAAVAWKTGLWYWNTQNGPGTMTAAQRDGQRRRLRRDDPQHQRLAWSATAATPRQVQSRVNNYQQFAQILGVTPGGNLYC